MRKARPVPGKAPEKKKKPESPDKENSQASSKVKTAHAQGAAVLFGGPASASPVAVAEGAAAGLASLSSWLSGGNRETKIQASNGGAPGGEEKTGGGPRGVGSRSKDEDSSSHPGSLSRVAEWFNNRFGRKRVNESELLYRVVHAIMDEPQVEVAASVRQENEEKWRQILSSDEETVLDVKKWLDGLEANGYSPLRPEYFLGDSEVLRSKIDELEKRREAQVIRVTSGDYTPLVYVEERYPAIELRSQLTFNKAGELNGANLQLVRSNQMDGLRASQTLEMGMSHVLRFLLLKKGKTVRGHAGSADEFMSKVPKKWLWPVSPQDSRPMLENPKRFFNDPSVERLREENYHHRTQGDLDIWEAEEENIEQTITADETELPEPEVELTTQTAPIREGDWVRAGSQRSTLTPEKMHGSPLFTYEEEEDVLYQNESY